MTAIAEAPAIQLPTYENVYVQRAFDMAHSAISASHPIRNDRERCITQLLIVARIVDTLLGFEGLDEAYKNNLAALAFAGVAMEYGGREIEGRRRDTLRECCGGKNILTFRFGEWSKTKGAFPKKPSLDMVVVNTAWLIHDGEDRSPHLPHLFSEKTVMQHVHQMNFNNAQKRDLPATVQARLRPALDYVLAL